MVSFTALILRFEKKGEKSGWTYIDVPADIAQQLVPRNKKSFRVKGFLDQFAISGVALMPVGEGDFIMAINGEMRKEIRKREGAMLNVSLELDLDYKVDTPPELEEYFEEDAEALVYFNSLAKSHRDYFIKWINNAKTQPTREKRIIATANAMSKKMDYGQMIRSLRVS